MALHSWSRPMTTRLVPPHGGRDLRPLQVSSEQRSVELARAAKLRRIRITSREKGDLVMLGIGGFTPLEGFMNRADWQGVCDDMCTSSGLFWPIPITLSTDRSTADSVAIGDEVALVDPDRETVIGLLSVEEKYTIDKTHECVSVFKTADPEHPGVRMVMEQGEVN